MAAMVGPVVSILYRQKTFDVVELSSLPPRLTLTIQNSDPFVSITDNN